MHRKTELEKIRLESKKLDFEEKRLDLDIQKFDFKKKKYCAELGERFHQGGIPYRLDEKFPVPLELQPNR